VLLGGRFSPSRVGKHRASSKPTPLLASVISAVFCPFVPFMPLPPVVWRAFELPSWPVIKTEFVRQIP
jgi:hypothetical protein